jgi:hypothetical protein
MSTTFSRQIRISQPLQKRLKKQRDFGALSDLAFSRDRLRIATFRP